MALTAYIISYLTTVLVLAWLTLIEEEGMYDVSGGEIVSLNQALHMQFLSLVRDFTIALALPQVCGLRWTVMVTTITRNSPCDRDIMCSVLHGSFSTRLMAKGGCG